MTDLAVVDGGVQLNQGLAGLDKLPLGNANGAHNARFERLNDLAAAGWNDLSRSSRNDINAAETCPYQAGHEQPEKRGSDGAP
ncbi:hypothetical protein S23_62580 [Bradyrhizobium cosmicum]|uniref:Uncharacterized protein n=1 Tax=Bradyrhizobium cosmicum TaxID=1404864 RepID=A0AAI8MJD5_9BRAD|nr:hypothetical protein S23_62580 [Bradyrhizobium cosmicum]